MDKQPATISAFHMKIAASLITAALIGLSGMAVNSHMNKISRSEFDEFCNQNKIEHERLQNQIEQQVRINAELLKSLNRMEVKIERVETNTEWLIKEIKK